MAVALTLRERALALSLRERALLLTLRASDVFTESEWALAGASWATSSALAEITTGIALSAEARSSSSAGGSLGLNLPASVAGTAASESTAAGAIASGIALTAMAESRSSAAGALATVAVSLSAVSQSQASAVGAVVTSIPLAASAASTSSAGGAVLIPIPLAGLAESASSAAGELNPSLILTGTLDGADLTSYPLEITVHYGSGTNSGSDVYLEEQGRADFADVRFKDDAGNLIPFWLRTKVDGDYAKCVVLAPTSPGYVVLQTGIQPTPTAIKLGLVGDPHYATADLTATAYVSHRTQVLTWLDRFNTRMGTFSPDLVVAMGDNNTAADASEKTSLLAAVEAKFAENTAPHVVIVGNHDFEYATPTEVRAVLAPSQTYLEAGKLYGSFDSGPFHVVVLDPEYAEASPYTHNSAVGGIGHGYIPTGASGSDNELGWLTADLAATTKPTIVLCHITLDEFDGSTFYTVPTSDFSRFSVTNRAAVRAVLEASGKVASVIHGHQHYFRTALVNGIPYIHTPSFCDTGAWPFRSITDSDRGRWVEMAIDHAKGEITADLYEDHSTRGAELAARQVVYYDATGTDRPSNPYRTFALGNAAQIDGTATGAPSFDGGDLTQWTVVTATVDETPTDMILAQTKYGDPVTSGGGLTLKGGTTAAGGTATRRYASQSGRFKVSFDLRLPQANKLFQVYLVNPEANAIGPRLQFTASGTILTGGGVQIGTYTANTAMAVEIVADVATDKWAVSINGTSLGSNISFDTPVTALDRLRCSWAAGANGTAHVDNIRWQPAAATEPTFSLWQVGLPPPPIGVRTSTGKLLFDGFSGTLAAWTTLGGSPSIYSGRLFLRSRPTNISDRVEASFARTTGLYVTAKIRHTYVTGDGLDGYTDSRIYLIDGTSYAAASYELGLFSYASAPRNNTLGRYVSSARTTIIDTGAKVTDTNEHAWAVKIGSGAVTIYKDGTQAGTVADATYSTFDHIDIYGATVDQDGSDFVELDDVAVMTSPIITVTGLPAGWKAKCAGVTAVESGGTALVDLSGKSFPQGVVQILDASDSIQGAFTAAADIWGGDVIDVGG